ncbi:MAG: TonB-dependent receptor plug domain-containing protein, partial [Prevotellaceae bacterium]|nr:TonB-dependent receptor plug domain-containing protein [Prevotellaceae bacterium]
MKNLKYILIVMLLLISGDAWAQTILSGKVTEEYDGKLDGLIGVNVTIVNSQNRTLTGVITDAEGAYNLRIPSDEKNMTVVFSYIGMKTERVKYSGQRTLNMTMVSDATTLDNVEVVAQRIERNTMGISQKEQVSATQRVQMDDLTATAPVFTVEEALQGQLGGVDIITGGGDPGAKSSIRIRGTSSLNSSSEPLIVIDGVPYSNEIDDDFDFATANDEDLGALLNIAPTDIQSIEVLKDAAATAIWGTKGANGVLMITTKRGSVGKTNFSFSSKFTTRIEPASIPMLNGKEYTALMQEAIWNAANYKGIANAGSELELLYNNPEIGYSPNWQYFNEYNQDTDWLGLVRRTGLSWDNNFSMSGGGEKATYRFSAGYLTDEGTTIGTKTTRLNTSLAIDYQFSRKLKFGADFSFSETNTDNNYANVRSEAFGKMPNKSPYWIDPATGLVTDQYFSRQTGFEDAFNG